MRIKIDNKNFISDKDKVFIIAEIGSNHNNNLKLAYKLIDEAKKAGADAVKFQTFKAEKHFSKYAPSFEFLKNKQMFKLIKSLEINRSWHKKLFEYCNKKKIIFFSSPCDYDAVDELHKIGSKLFKIASFDITDLKLLKYIASKKKPIIISTGLASIEDISRAIKVCKSTGNKKIILLECTSIYPAPENIMNLNAIKYLKKRFKVITGLSDHSMGDHMILASISLGAKVIEKHFTLDRKMKGPDHSFAMMPKEFLEMVQKIRRVESGLGSGIKGEYSKIEKIMAVKSRRSIHVNSNIKKGQKFKMEDLIIKRPGYGIEPYLINKIIGKIASRNIKKDHWLKWQMIKK